MLETRVRSVRWNDGHRGGTAGWTAPGAPPALTVDVVVCAVGLFGAPRVPDIAGTDRLHRHAHAHRAVGSPRRPGGQEGGGDRHRRQRGPGRSRTGQDRRARHASFNAHRRGWCPRTTAPTAHPNWRDSAATPWPCAAPAGRSGSFSTTTPRPSPTTPSSRRAAQVATSFLERTVADERLRRSLTPDNPFRCKRVLLGDGSLPVLCSRTTSSWSPTPSSGSTSRRCSPRRGGPSYPDAIVLATGFETSRYLSGIDVIGIGGLPAARALG